MIGVSQPDGQLCAHGPEVVLHQPIPGMAMGAEGVEEGESCQNKILIIARLCQPPEYTNVYRIEACLTVLERYWHKMLMNFDFECDLADGSQCRLAELLPGVRLHKEDR